MFISHPPKRQRVTYVSRFHPASASPLCTSLKPLHRITTCCVCMLVRFSIGNHSFVLQIDVTDGYSALLENLSPETKYEIHVKSNNTEHESEPSETVYIKTTAGESQQVMEKSLDGSIIKCIRNPFTPISLCEYTNYFI